MHENPIKEYVYQIWKRRKVVFIFMGAVLLITVFMTFRQPKVYRAAAVIEIGAETPDMFFQDVVNVSPYGWWSALKYYETQYQILQSRSLLTRVAERALDQKIVASPSVAALTGELQGGISIGSDEKSRLATIYFDTNDPERATKLVNLIAEVYVDENLVQKRQGITQAITWLSERLEETRREKRAKEDELQKKKEEFRVVSVTDGQNVAKSNLAALTESLNSVKNKRIEIEAQYRKLSQLVKETAEVDDLLGVVSNELLQKLKEDLAAVKSERSRLAHRYGEKHPTMVRINKETAELEKLISKEVNNEVSRYRTKFLIAKAEEESLQNALEKQKLETLRIEEVNREVMDIELVTTMNQQLFESLQKKLKEADLSSLLRSNNIRIVDRALVPGRPIKPNVKANILLAFAIGLMGGIGLALGLEYLDDTFKTHEDVERYLQLNVIGMIPRYAEQDGIEGETLLRPVEFVPSEDPSSPVSEFYRTFRTNVLFLTATRKGKSVMFVSTGPGEGKTSIALNHSITLAQIGLKTILVELDLRRPKLHGKFEAKSRVGITNVLVGEAPLDQAIQHSRIENLDYLLAGSLPPNPAELLASNEMKEVIAKLREKYDRVVFDSSPIAPVTDSIIISQSVDGVIMVVRSGKTQRKVVKFAVEQLRGVKAEILGAVLNDVDLEKSTYGNYQYYKYGYETYSSEPEGPTLPPATA